MAKAAEPQGSLLTGFGSAWEGQDRGPTSLLWLCRGRKTQHNCAVKTEKSFLEDHPGNTFMRTHAQVQGVHAILSICNTSKVQKSG